MKTPSNLLLNSSKDTESLAPKANSLTVNTGVGREKDYLSSARHMGRWFVVSGHKAEDEEMRSLDSHTL